MSPAAEQPTEPADAVLTLDGWAHGGEAVGRLPDGMACFVAYALPGETVRVRVTTRHKRWARADLLEVIDPSPDRVEPPCPYFGACGGCLLQHASPQRQLQLKARVLREQLERIGKLEPPEISVRPVGDSWPGGYRAWARMGVADDGRLGFRRHASNDIEPIDRCLLLQEGTQAVRDAAGDAWEGVEEVTLLAGEDAGLVLVHPGRGGMPPLPDGDLGAAIQGVGRPPVIRPPGHVVIRVGETPLRVSAGSFFQSGPDAATALAEAVTTAVLRTDPRPTPSSAAPRLRVLDLYAGVGLFSSFLAQAGAIVTAVESNEVAVEDARHNLEGLDVQVIAETVEEALTTGLVAGADPDVIVLDPPRSGAGPDICRSLADLGPQRIVYVACDPAALARDARALTTAGWHLAAVDAFDTFGHTAHVEAVATFVPLSTGLTEA